MEQNIAQQSKSESSDFLKWVKAYSPAIDFAASTAISLGVPYCFGASLPWSLGVMALSIPFEFGKNYFAENTDYLGEGYFKAFLDNLPGSAMIYGAEKGSWDGAKDKYVAKDATGNFSKSDVTGEAKVHATVLGFQGVGQSTVVAQIVNGTFVENADKYSFDNTLVSLRFGAYFFIKKMIASELLLGQGIFAKAVAGMTAGFLAKTAMKASTYLLNEEGFENFYPASLKDAATVFINSALYAVQDSVGEWIYPESTKGAGNAGFGYYQNVFIATNIEAIDAVIKKDILGNNKDEAVIHSVYDLAHSEPVQTVCDAACEVKDWVFEKCGYFSEAEYQESIVACA